MENLSNEELLNVLGNYSVIQLIELTRELEKKWKLKAEPQLVQSTVTTTQEAVAVKTEFDVHLISVPADKKMSVIKAVREVMMLGLKESKDFVEAAPKVLKESATAEEAEAIKVKLTEAGALVEVK